MKSHLIFFLLVLFFLTSCKVNNGGHLHGSKKTAHVSAPSGKYKNPRMFSTANPFQGRAKSALDEEKKEKKGYFAIKKEQNSREKATKDFNTRRRFSGTRVKSSGNRGMDREERRKNKNLFDTKKE